MTCVSPLTGFRTPSGTITLIRSQGYVDRSVTVACGQCMGCRIDRSMMWANRIMHESQMHESNSFITLTYDDEHLPFDESLDVKHWQNFAKRLRKQKGPFRFYHVGEYGDRFGRAHYHACLFGLDFAKDRMEAAPSAKGYPQWESPQLTEIWGQGATTISMLVPETALYTAKYINKKQKTDQYDGRKPPYATMSKGIGKSWYEKHKKDLFPHDYCIRKGSKNRVPSYYDKLLELEDPELHAHIKTERKKKALTSGFNPDRRYARQIILQTKESTQ